MPKFNFSFVSHKRKRVALFDASGISILNQYVPDHDLSVIDVEHLNFFAAVRMLAGGKKSLFDYTVAYIKTFKPQFVFTFIDNNIDFYKFAAIFPKVRFISIQNGFRSNYANQMNNGFFDVLENESANHALSAHVICVLGSNEGDKYSKHIQAKQIITGSLKNNLIGGQIEPKEQFDIVYVSQHAPFEIPNSEFEFFFGSKSITASDFYAIEEYIVRFLVARCNRTNQSFAVLGKRSDSSSFEREFFDSAAAPHSVHFIPRTSDTSTYEFCNSASLIVTTDSTIGFEFLARGKKVAFLSARIDAIDHVLSQEVHDTDFGFPLELGTSGPFWTNAANESEFERVIGSIQSMSDTQWASTISPYNEILMAYQPGNTAFIQMLRSEGIPTKNEVTQRA
jgi:surface carbohydrate biosynthesis protein